MEGTVVGDDLAGEEGDTDDEQQERVERRAGDKQARPDKDNKLQGRWKQKIQGVQRIIDWLVHWRNKATSYKFSE